MYSVIDTRFIGGEAKSLIFGGSRRGESDASRARAVGLRRNSREESRACAERAARTPVHQVCAAQRDPQRGEPPTSSRGPRPPLFRKNELESQPENRTQENPDGKED